MPIYMVKFGYDTDLRYENENVWINEYDYY